MATVQKTTLKRYNGTDWDPVYLGTSADIAVLGTAVTVLDDPVTVWEADEIVTSDTGLLGILTNLINYLAFTEATTLPAIRNGSTITAINAAIITGIINRTNLPADVGGNSYEVATEAAKDALTPDDVEIGDIVKVTGGTVYSVKGKTADTVTYMALTSGNITLDWSSITGTPTTLDGYGITDAVDNDTFVIFSEDYAIFKSTTSSDIQDLQDGLEAIDASQVTTGVFNIARIPNAALERLTKVNTTADLATVTAEQAQNGDTIQTLDTGLMYLVVDDSKLNTADYMAGLVEYTAGTAAAVNWTGVLGTPTTLAGYGITDAATTTQMTDATDRITALETGIDAIDASQITTGVIATARLPMDILVNKVVSVNSIAEMLELTAENVISNDVVNVIGTGMYFVTDPTKLGTIEAFTPVSAGAAASVEWDGVLNTPTTVEGYGITNAVTDADVINSALPVSTDNAAKIVALNANGLLEVNITGDAATLGGNGPTYYATSTRVEEVALGTLSIVDTLPTDATTGQFVLERTV